MGALRLLPGNLLVVDDEAWLRGRGWALYQAVSALPYYWTPIRHDPPGGGAPR